MGKEKFKFDLTERMWVSKEQEITPEIRIKEENDIYISGEVFLAKDIFADEGIKFNSIKIRKDLSKWTVREKEWEEKRFHSFLTDSGILFKYILDDNFLESEVMKRDIYEPI